jgi:TolB-like protein
MKKAVFIFMMLFSAAAFTQELSDAVVSPSASGIIAEENILDSAAAEELSGIAAERELPDSAAAEEPPDIAVEQELPNTAAAPELPQTAPDVSQDKPDTAAAKDLPNIAVYVTGNVSEDEKKALGTRMLASLVNSGRYRGVERSSSFLDEIDKEQIKQRSGAIDDSQISNLGKQFGVKYVCIADITPAYGGFQVSARVVDVETAVVVFIGESTSPLKTIDDLTNVSDRVVRRMFGLPEPPEESTSIFRKLGVRISGGAGGFFASDFGGGIAWGSGARVAMPYTGGGAYIFVDATYVEVFAGYSAGGGKWESASASDPKDLPDMLRGYMHGGLFAKYPFGFGRVQIYPLMGVEYEYTLSGKLKYENLSGNYVFDGMYGRYNTNALSASWGKLGGGVDFALGKSVYLRSEFLYGVRTANWFEKDSADKQAVSGGKKAKGNYGHGLTAKLGCGINL